MYFCHISIRLPNLVHGSLAHQTWHGHMQFCLKKDRAEQIGIILDFCVDHVISTGCRMLKLVLDICYCYFFYLWPRFKISGTFKVSVLSLLSSGTLIRVICNSFTSDFDVSWKNIKTNIQNSTLNLSFDALLKWHDPHICQSVRMFWIFSQVRLDADKDFSDTYRH